MLLFAGLSNIPLAENIAHHLNLSLSNTHIGQFPDSETMIEILSDVMHQPVVIIQSLSNPTNHHLMELLLLANTLQQKGASPITAVIPYCAYARQEKMAFLAALVKSAGIEKILTLTYHHPKSCHDLKISLQLLETTELFAIDIIKRSIDNPVIISPDLGGIERAKTVHHYLKTTNFITLNKKEDLNTQAENLNLRKILNKRNCIIIDDIVDTAKTLCQTVTLLKNHGAEQVHAYITHGILSQNALSTITKMDIETLTLTNSLVLSPEITENPKIRVLNVAPLLAKALLL